MTLYQMNSFDQIISLPVAKSSGYDFTLTNGGEISNKGIEIAADLIGQKQKISPGILKSTMDVIERL